jgi:hypothetical protein
MPQFTKTNTQKATKLVESWLGSASWQGYDVPLPVIESLARLAIVVVENPSDHPMHVAGYPPEDLNA